MADSYFNLADWGCVPQQEEIFAKSQAAAQKALELDPTFADNHITLGELAFYHQWDWPTAEKEYRRAIELDPNNGHGPYAIFLVAMGRTDEGLAEIRKERELDPTSELSNVMDAYVSYLAHRYDEAISKGTKALELYPDSGAIYYWLAQSYEQKGMKEQAVAAYWKSDAGLGPQWITASKNAYKKDGMRGFWRHQLEMKIDNQPVAPCIQPLLYAHMGDKERTLNLLSSSYQHHCDGLQFLNVEPAYNNVRGDPRFKEIVARLHL
jgi:tetratricopeptide (TPR) repeat protein